ncbi:hypothetical protein F2S73_30250, partial [Pseudomonas syringae pv. actinidiae]|nr:hypothetical protein [Pseudomonas syringae pv. actinidiae]
DLALHLEREQGMTPEESIRSACLQRLRPILMTSLAFMFGVLPLAISSGAGSAGRQAIGTGVLGGMFSATLLGIFLVPLFFVEVRRRFSRALHTAPAVPSTSAGEA